MTHAEMAELYELYVLGVLEPELAAEIEAHLRDGCEHCSEKIALAARVTAAMAGLAEPKQPSAGLKDRVLASIQRAPLAEIKRPQTHRPWLIPLLAAACLILLASSIWSTSALNRTRDELTAMRTERNQLRSALEVLGRSDTRAVQFGRAETVPHGRVLANRTGGLVFVGSKLPALAQNRTYQLWLIPNTGAPVSAGVFRPTSSGDSVQVSQLAADPARNKAVAVSVEPDGGSPAPTTTPILVVPLS